MSDVFSDVVAGLFQEGEEQAVETAAHYEADTFRCYKTITMLTDQMLNLVGDPMSLVEALHEAADEIIEAFGGDDDEA